MAYRDPALLRTHVVKVRFSDEENDLLEALANLTGEQKAVMIRNLILDRAYEVMSCGQSGVSAQGVEVPFGGRLCA